MMNVGNIFNLQKGFAKAFQMFDKENTCLKQLEDCILFPSDKLITHARAVNANVSPAGLRCGKGTEFFPLR